MGGANLAELSAFLERQQMAQTERDAKAEAKLGLGRIVALYYHSSTSYHIR